MFFKKSPYCVAWFLPSYCLTENNLFYSNFFTIDKWIQTHPFEKLQKRVWLAKLSFILEIRFIKVCKPFWWNWSVLQSYNCLAWFLINITKETNVAVINYRHEFDEHEVFNRTGKLKFSQKKHINFFTNG